MQEVCPCNEKVCKNLHPGFRGSFRQWNVGRLTTSSDGRVSNHLCMETRGKVTDEPNKTGRSYSQRKAHSRNHDEIPKRRYLKSFMWYSQSFPHEHRDRNHCFLDGRLLSITVPVEKTFSHSRIKAHTLTKSVELFWRFTRWKVARRSRLRKTICKKAEHFTISTTMLP
jgi:hypothetical protein